jgi:serine/threonine protein phosphatase PrpC
MLVDPELGLYIVADGMGGHAAGEVASKRATESVREHIRTNQRVLKDLVRSATPKHRASAADLVEVAIQRACAEIYRMAEHNSSMRGMGTTLVCLATAGNKGIIGHVGDSRVYLLRNGQCHRLTEDHTLVAAQLKSGALSKAEAASSKFRNVITRAVGIQASVQVDTLLVELLPGDTFVLCSDGLHTYLADDEMISLTRSVSTKDLPKKMIDIANKRGGRDNITAIVVALKPEGEAAIEELDEAQSRMEALRKIPLFRHLTYKEQTALLSISSSRTYEPEEEIITEGENGEELYVIVRGKVAVEKNGVHIAELEAGGHFGEMGLVDNAPRSATVRAREPTRVIAIARAELMSLMKRESVLAVKMLWSLVQVLSDRLRVTNSELSDARQELAVAHAVQPFAED